jgi:hypothetical protein
LETPKIVNTKAASEVAQIAQIAKAAVLILTGSKNTSPKSPRNTSSE